MAIDPQGVIRAKIEPDADGKNIAEAFRAFKRDVEWRLGELLKDVPSGVGGPVEAGVGKPTGVGRERMSGEGRVGDVGRVPDGGRAGRSGDAGGDGDAPPAYGDVKTGLH